MCVWAGSHSEEFKLDEVYIYITQKNGLMYKQMYFKIIQLYMV